MFLPVACATYLSASFTMKSLTGWDSLLKFYSFKCIHFAVYIVTSVYTELETGKKRPLKIQKKKYKYNYVCICHMT